eukprot:Opistho-2@57038
MGGCSQSGHTRLCMHAFKSKKRLISSIENAVLSLATLMFVRVSSESRCMSPYISPIGVFFAMGERVAWGCFFVSGVSCARDVRVDRAELRLLHSSAFFYLSFSFLPAGLFFSTRFLLLGKFCLSPLSLSLCLSCGLSVSLFSHDSIDVDMEPSLPRRVGVGRGRVDTPRSFYFDWLNG